MSSLNRKINANKTKHFLNDNALSYYRGKQYFDEGSGKQNYLVFLPIGKYFKLNSVVGAADYVGAADHGNQKDYLMKVLSYLQHLITVLLQN